MHYSNSIKIKTIPQKIKIKVIKSLHKKVHIVGYKVINSQNKVPIIELSNYTRIWILPNEIKINIT
uniref:Cytochrome b6-f complex subunit PetP n=1 Tax=Cumathamnion serrulatum TaxID=1206573 RepID=A0A7U1AR66_9FLOR|nr:cytochrome b6-f complex subunit PetP [Cumathamnion serrulatum]QQY85406.1 cytochrome b6-f complex subunit PetP [Cumathamnion serrulatum]